MEYTECTKCGLTKSLADMKTDGRAQSGYMSPAICVECHKDARKAKMAKSQKERRARNGHSEWYRNYMRLRNYNMTQEQFEELLAKQGGVCAICGSDSPGEKSWATDHDHTCCEAPPTCGKCTRGLLCHKCNRMLGLVNDNPDILLAAVEYLKPPTYTKPDLSFIHDNRFLS